MFQRVYSLKLSYVVVFMVIGIIFWTIAAMLCAETRYKSWKVINVIFAVIAIFTVISETIIQRDVHKNYYFYWMPFHSFFAAKEQPEVYRSMLMNVFLFFPLGLSLPFALPEQWRHRAAWAILAAFLLSLSVELLQFFLSLGQAETDDVLCNTLGAALGAVPFWLTARIDRRH